MIPIATDIVFVLLGLAAVAVLIRLVRGPTAGDRILALDMLMLLAIGAVAAFAVRTGQYLYLDVAVALALVGLLSTAAFARYLAHGDKR